MKNLCKAEDYAWLLCDFTLGSNDALIKQQQPGKPGGHPAIRESQPKPALVYTALRQWLQVQAIGV